MRFNRRHALAAVLVAATFPASAFAQAPGDEQYTDPFGSGDTPAAEATPAPAAPAPSAPAPAAPAPAPAAPAPAASTAQAAPAAAPAELPYTGSPVAAAVLAAAGALLLASGLTLRVRLRDRDGA